MKKFNDYTVSFNSNHIIKNISYAGVKLNLLEVSELDNPVLNVFAKVDGKFLGLLNKEISKTVQYYKNGVKYCGSVEGLRFEISFIFNGNTMITSVCLSEECELIYTQDIGLNAPGNTLYASQYIDNRVYENDFGYNIIMRKTQKTETGYPLIQNSANQKVVEYATEGFDVFSKKFRENKDNTAIELLSRERNYELAMSALKVVAKEVKFAALVKENHEESVTNIMFEDINYDAHLEELVEEKNTQAVSFDLLNGTGIQHDCEKIQVEEVEGTLLSYFTQEYAHVVTPEKEVQVDRQHAHIITSKAGDKFNPETLVSSNYMTGIFWAQNAISNTAMHTYNLNTKSYMDFNITEGLRIFIKKGEKYSLLNMPSSYEMGFNYSKWIYQLTDNRIEVIVYTSVNDTNLRLEFKSEKVVDIVAVEGMNPNFVVNNNEITPMDGSLAKKTCPELKYFLNHDGKFVDGFSLNGVEVTGTYSLEFEGITETTITMSTYKPCTEGMDFATEKKAYRKHFDMLVRNVRFKEMNEDVEAFNITLYWFMHNGLIHFATPHGVEQHAGAAWGTRDVCQGPVELFSAFGHYNVVREILLQIYKNQNLVDGNWQQWFMFDKYHFIRYHESHGDVVVWPVKALGDYLTATKDLGILDEMLPFYEKEDFSKESFKLIDHVKSEIDYIKKNFIPGTFISKYLDGDWDDTLQPTNDELRQKMASGWTVSLTYQAVKTFAIAIESYDVDYAAELLQLSKDIKADYLKYFFHDGVPAGFIIIDGDDVEYLLHPRDKKSGINYRLLPMTRGIINGMFDEEQAKVIVEKIDEHLMFPDGVRLMNHPVQYSGGVEKIFQRGESATTIGREVSLQYVHAHIRYIEAMCKMDDGVRAYHALKVVNPILANKYLKHANLRQRNAYYSSSEGDVDNRYVYDAEFAKMKTGEILVKSGWRIYSSGPGIYLNQLLKNFMKMDVATDGSVSIDCICEELKGLTLEI